MAYRFLSPKYYQAILLSPIIHTILLNRGLLLAVALTPQQILNMQVVRHIGQCDSFNFNQ